ncbi:VOC family protein [Pedobacter montanisoli]|uniref:VOC family protein n=1 Tax=Pedobacter montanisoli TaxID=2923277 RepID=A0ABS9ZXR0_9SPHI|nr:VOC family protein [Pedobacter montanisoli]MCJ0743095.1 VOC family protein [Pedobacter montanisoli]
MKELLQGIDTIIIRVSSIRKAATWYKEKLELSALWEDEGLNLVVLDTNSAVSITLWQTKEPIEINKKTAAYPIFKTPNADLLRAKLELKDVEVDEILQDDHVRYFFFYDPDGNVLEACQVIAH